MPQRSAAHLEDGRMGKCLLAAAIGAGTAAAIVGGFHLVLWLSGSMTYRGLHAYTMKANASLCLLLCGVALALAVPEDPGNWRRRSAVALAASAVAIAGLTLLEHLFDLDLGIDQLIAREAAGAIGFLPPNRMGPSAALGFILSGIGTMLLLYREIRVAQATGLALCFIAIPGILGRLYHAGMLYAAPPLTGIASPTAVAILLLGLGLLLARPRQGFVATFTSKSPGGVASRRLLLPAIVLPVVLGWLRLQGEARGLYDTTFGTGMLVLSWIVIFSFLVYQVAKRVEVQQKAVEDELTRENLRESEQRLRSIIDNMSEGLVVVDPGTGALYWNRKALEMYHYDAQSEGISFLDELTDVFELTTLEGRPVPFEQWPVQRILRGEELHDLELVVTDKKRNRQGIYTYSGTLARDAEGRSQMGLVTLRDITDKKKAEESLRESEELLRTVLETLPVAVWVLDANGSVLRTNRAAQELWGRAPHVGMDEFGIYKGWRPETGERIPAQEWYAAKTITRGETFLNQEVLIETFDGLRKTILTSSVPIRNERGEITGAISVNQDITRRKEAERALRESEEKFRGIFQQAAVGMGRVSFADARWIDVNQAFCNMLGYSSDELLAMPWPAITHHEDLDLDLVPFRKMAAGELDNYSVEKRFIHKQGHHVWARLTLSLVRDLYGEPDYEIAIIEDITRRKEAEEGLRRAKDELEQRVRERTSELERAYADLKRETERRLAAVEDLREKEQLLVQQTRLAAMGEMLGNIAHQWRQPLNTLGLLIQQLQLVHDLGNFDREFLEGEVAKAMGLIRHMSQTVADFKDFLKEEKEAQQFSLNDAVVTTIRLLEAPLKAGRVLVEIVQVEELFVTGHRNEFCHVIMNLVNNAQDAFKERSVATPRIQIRIFREEGRPQVTVADNAGGIPQEIMGRIFEPYFTTKGTVEGTGIGLYMSRNIIEKNMGGRLTVTNTAEGAEFRLSFPAGG